MLLKKINRLSSGLMKLIARAKCKFQEKCKWLCYGAIDRDSGNFMIKNFHAIQKYVPSNKNKMSTTKFLATRFKD